VFLHVLRAPGLQFRFTHAYFILPPVSSDEMLRKKMLFSSCPDEFFHQWPGVGDTNGAWGGSGESAKLLWGEILASIICWQKTDTRGQNRS
jgi:hypothetical protein